MLLRHGPLGLCWNSTVATSPSRQHAGRRVGSSGHEVGTCICQRITTTSCNSFAQEPLHFRDLKQKSRVSVTHQ